MPVGTAHPVRSGGCTATEKRARLFFPARIGYNAGMTEPTLVVLAAGMGRRYGGLKQVDPVGPGGETILDYSIFDARRAGFERVVFVIRRDIEALFRERVGSRFERWIDVEYAFQEIDDVPFGLTAPSERARPWGTAHAIWASRHQVDGPFAVINADDYYGSTSYRLIANRLAAAEGRADFAMIGYRLGNTLSPHGGVNRAVCRTNSDGDLVHAEEITGITPDPADDALARYPVSGGFKTLARDTLVSMNLFAFTPVMYGFIEEYLRDFLLHNGESPDAELYIPAVVNMLIAGGRIHLRVIPSPDSWFGVTYREDRPYVETEIQRLIDAGTYPKRLWAEQAE